MHEQRSSGSRSVHTRSVPSHGTYHLLRPSCQCTCPLTQRPALTHAPSSKSHPSYQLHAKCDTQPLLSAAISIIQRDTYARARSRSQPAPAHGPYVLDPGMHEAEDDARLNTASSCTTHDSPLHNSGAPQCPGWDVEAVSTRGLHDHEENTSDLPFRCPPHPGTLALILNHPYPCPF